MAKLRKVEPPTRYVFKFTVSALDIVEHLQEGFDGLMKKVLDEYGPAEFSISGNRFALDYYDTRVTLTDPEAIYPIIELYAAHGVTIKPELISPS